MTKMILCTDSKGGIGKNGTIPWHSTEDFKHFKNETQGKKVLMGYRTWESLPKRPLPDRMNIVVTTRPVPCEVQNVHRDVVFIHINWLPLFLKFNRDVIVIGGASIYRAAMPFCSEVIHSTIEGDFNCDTFFDVGAFDEWGFSTVQEKVLPDGVNVAYMKRSARDGVWGDWV